MSTKLSKAIKRAGVKPQDFIVPLLMFAWLLYQFISSFYLKKNKYDVLGAGGWPRIVCVLGFVCIGIYLIQKIVAVLKCYNQSDAEIAAEDMQQDTEASQDDQRGFVALMRRHHELFMILFCILYVFLIDYVGFIIASFLFLLGTMLLFTRNKSKKMTILIVALALLFSIGIYYLFYNVFSIILPAGQLF